VRKFVIPVEVEPLEEGGYLAVCEPIQGCHAEGETVAEALDNLEDVARTLLELRREDGLPPPAGLEELRPGTVVKAQLVVSIPE
jgi:predicted RNase H-like HicB family nuclease